MNLKLIKLLLLSCFIAISYCNDNFNNDDSSSEQKSYGEPLNVLKFNDKNQVDFEFNKIDQMFNHPEIKDRKIYPVSITGITGKGKSFFLNYCLRYLYANFKSINVPNNTITDNWMGDPDLEFEFAGFPWKSGTENGTNGIDIWSDIFLYDAPNGDKFAIILIDLQGLTTSNVFENNSAEKNTKLFNLATLMSSMQIFNSAKYIQESQLSYFQFAANFEKYLISINAEYLAGDEKLFQNVLFLVRDWSRGSLYPYGLEGGKNYLKRVLQIQAQSTQSMKVGTALNSTYESVNCFLLPYPGNAISNNPNYNGKWWDLDHKFVRHLKESIEWLFNPSNFKAKKILGNLITVEKYPHYLKRYFNIAKESIVSVSDIYKATINAEGNFCAIKAFDIYINSMKTVDPQSIDDLNVNHRKGLTKAMATFSEMFNNNEMTLKWRNNLENQIVSEYNKMKRKFDDDSEEFLASTISTVSESLNKPTIKSSEEVRTRTTASSTTRRPNQQSTSFYQNQVETNHYHNQNYFNNQAQDQNQNQNQDQDQDQDQDKDQNQDQNQNQGRINQNELEINENSLNTNARAKMDAITTNHNAEQQSSTVTIEQCVKCENDKLLEELKELKDAVKEYERIFHEKRRTEMNRRKECEIEEDNTDNDLKEIAIKKLTQELNALKGKNEITLENADAIEKIKKLQTEVTEANHRILLCQDVAIQHRQDDQKKYRDLSVKYDDLSVNYNECKVQNPRFELFKDTTEAPQMAKPLRMPQPVQIITLS